MPIPFVVLETFLAACFPSQGDRFWRGIFDFPKTTLLFHFLVL